MRDPGSKKIRVTEKDSHCQSLASTCTLMGRYTCIYSSIHFTHTRTHTHNWFLYTINLVSLVMFSSRVASYGEPIGSSMEGTLKAARHIWAGCVGNCICTCSKDLAAASGIWFSYKHWWKSGDTNVGDMGKFWTEFEKHTATQLSSQSQTKASKENQSKRECTQGP